VNAVLETSMYVSYNNSSTEDENVRDTKIWANWQ